jgi:hypothetical protein
MLSPASPLPAATVTLGLVHTGTLGGAPTFRSAGWGGGVEVRRDGAVGSAFRRSNGLVEGILIPDAENSRR